MEAGAPANEQPDRLPPGRARAADPARGLLRQADVDSFDEMLGAISKGRAVMFVGAGPSVPFYGTGYDLASCLCDEARLAHRNESLPRVAERCLATLGKRRYSEILIDKFGNLHDDVHQSVHLLMARAPFDAYLTTNYDTCIERAFAIQGRRHGDVLSHPDTLSAGDLGNKSVFHIHGRIADANQDPDSLQVVLAESEYAKAYNPENGHLSDLLGEVLVKSATRTIVLCGYSFSEPNCVLDSLSRASSRLEQLARTYAKGEPETAKPPKRKHYALLAVPSFPDVTYWEETAADVDRLLEGPRAACQPVVELVSILYANTDPSGREKGHEYLRRLLTACADVKLVAAKGG